MKLKPTEFDVVKRGISSNSMTVTDEDIAKYLSVKQWFQHNGIPVTKFAWFAAFEWDYGDWYTPNFDADKETVWYEMTE